MRDKDRKKNAKWRIGRFIICFMFLSFWPCWDYCIRPRGTVDLKSESSCPPSFSFSHTKNILSFNPFQSCFIKVLLPGFTQPSLQLEENCHETQTSMKPHLFYLVIYWCCFIVDIPVTTQHSHQKTCHSSFCYNKLHLLRSFWPAAITLQLLEDRYSFCYSIKSSFFIFFNISIYNSQ